MLMYVTEHLTLKVCEEEISEYIHHSLEAKT